MNIHPDAEEAQNPVQIAKSPVLLRDETFRLLVDQITDYAIFLLTPDGEVATWNPGAERIKGYRRDDIVGRHFRTFYPPREQEARKPEYELKVASATGRFEDEGWRVRKDGSRFWANVIIIAIRNSRGELLGFGKVTRDLTERKKAEDQLRELSGRLLRLQDDERRRLGRDLHDSVGQYLVAAKMALDGFTGEERFAEARSRRRIEDCARTIDKAIRELRTLSYLLYPPMLEETGLSSAIRWHLEGFSKRSGVSTTYELPNTSTRLPEEVELALFRVFQESLTNIHRHSQSKTAHIRFAVDDSEAVLEIRDQGKGMQGQSSPLQVGPETLGVGIRGMRERLRQLRGKLEINSTATGTMVKASIPVHASAANDAAEFS